MKRIAVVGAVFGALLSSGAAIGQGPGTEHHGPREGRGPGGPGGPGFGPPPIEMITERLGLSEDQQAQLKALREKNRADNKALFDSARAAHEAFDKALEADAPDAATVGRLAIALHATQKKMDAVRRADFEQMKSILTPEQIEMLPQRPHEHGPEGRAGSRQ